MEIKYIDGCTATSLTIDGRDTSDIDISKIKSAIKRVINIETDRGSLQQILMDLIERNGIVENVGYCEQCGDSIYTYVLELKE